MLLYCIVLSHPVPNYIGSGYEGYWTTRGYANSRLDISQIGQLVD